MSFSEYIRIIVLLTKRFGNATTNIINIIIQYYFIVALIIYIYIYKKVITINYFYIPNLTTCEYPFVCYARL